MSHRSNLEGLNNIPRVSSSRGGTTRIVEEETKSIMEKSILFSKIPASTGIVNRPKKEFRLDDAVFMSMKKNELEENLEKMNHSTLVSAYIQLMEKLRNAENQSEVKEELLKYNRKKLEESEALNKQLIRDVNELRGNRRRNEEAALLRNNFGRVEEDPCGTPLSRCRYEGLGCRFEQLKMSFHEREDCRFRPVRCPSLTCDETPSFNDLWRHIDEFHDGTIKGRDTITRNEANHLVSSYVNIDHEPIFYKKSKMTWVANEMCYDGRRFFLECMRVPPNWHLWVYVIGTSAEANRYATTISLFKEEEYVRLSSDNGLTTQRSFTGPVIPINVSKEDIAEKGLGFMVHDNQIRPLCGPIHSREEQLFGYEVTVYGKELL